jgi:hypothetical protein
VFYVAASAFTTASPNCRTGGCKYLEAAPNTWNGGTDPTRTWATNANQSKVVSGAYGLVVGTGYQNSVAIVNQTGNVAASSAAVLARGYGGGTKSDWFLPSKDELNQLYLQKIGVGGFASGFYWSSSEVSADNAWHRDFFYGYQDNTNKGATFYVRPVRAF